MSLVGGFGCLALCLYGIRELVFPKYEERNDEDIAFHCSAVPLLRKNNEFSEPALTQSVGCEDVRAGETGHLCRSGLARHPGVKILTFLQNIIWLGGV